MLKKKYRLKNSNAFSATFRLKNCKSNDLLIIYCGKDKNDSYVPTKVGFVVSKKIHKRAVKRNKIKRRLREIYCEAQKNNRLNAFQNALSLVIIAKAKILDVNYLQIKDAFYNLLEQF